MLVGVVDSLMLSSVSDETVGAVGTASTYIGLLLDEVVRAIIMFVRYRSGKWENKVIVKTKSQDNV